MVRPKDLVAFMNLIESFQVQKALAFVPYYTHASTHISQCMDICTYVCLRRNGRDPSYSDILGHLRILFP